MTREDEDICCIHEFSSIKEAYTRPWSTRYVAKAGMVIKLHTRSSVLSVTIPKGQYEQSLSLNIAIASPLLSRLNLVLTLLDTRNEAWDKTVSDYILSGRDIFSSPCGLPSPYIPTLPCPRR